MIISSIVQWSRRGGRGQHLRRPQNLQRTPRI